MTTNEFARPCRVFIGSSSEGKTVARALQESLLRDCEPVMWDSNVFEPSGYTLDSLIAEAHRCDFAVLVATGDDDRISREQRALVPRDNVILEFGLFAGALGRKRTYVLSTGQLELPSDMLGLTRLAYHDNQNNVRLAVAQAANQVRDAIATLGPCQAQGQQDVRASGPLAREVDLLKVNASQQGWSVQDSATTLRLKSPAGKTYSLSKSGPVATRQKLRKFAAEVRAAGLRVNSAVRNAPEESPFV